MTDAQAKPTPSTAWFAATLAITHALQVKTLPKGLSHAVVAEWDMWINTGEEAATIPGHESQPLRRFHIAAFHQQYIRFALLDPAGGAIAGYSEDLFIEEMKAALPEEQRGLVA